MYHIEPDSWPCGPPGGNRRKSLCPKQTVERQQFGDYATELARTLVRQLNQRLTWLSSESEMRCLPLASKFPGSSHCSNARLRAGHSESSIAYQAVSRLRPFTIMCW